MFEIKIVDIKSNQQTHGALFATEQEVQDWISLVKTKVPCPWGNLERLIVKSQATEQEILDAIQTIPEVIEQVESPIYDEEGNQTGTELIDVVVSPEMIKLPQDFTVEIIDITEEYAAEQEMQQLIAQGEANEKKCRKALAYIGGYNEARNLDAAQTNIMQATFGTVFQMLLANRPNTARQLISEIEVDGTLITQQLKDVVLGLLS